ncbi:hypothetical protein [Lewinella sp. IMCC34191]|uniref:hypothetical protein n=1 Tax=Lewinella sp. IMCC34191 TaxID=2259172 RepID=UPI000E27D66A|nr:hypothetical protein [Lewinella sp. IMCC34191]
MQIRFSRFFPLLLIFGLPVAGFAQKTYEPGYLIDGSGKREAVEILNKDWRHNPAEILVRRTADQEPITVPTQALREFGIDGKARYINRHVAIEKSSVSRSTRSTTRPVQEVERVLLRVEVEGNASLYSYLAPRVNKYFISLDDSQFTQLVYTVHRASDGNLTETRTFVRQLDRMLACGNAFSVPSDLKYQLDDLRDIVSAYNTCAYAGPHTIYENEPARENSFLVTLQPGIYHTDFKLTDRENHERIVDSKNRSVLRLGVETEYMFSYGGHTLSAIFRPSYYRFSGHATPTESPESEYIMEYAALDLPVALRYHHPLQEDINVFATGGIGLLAPFGKLHENGQELSKMKGTLSACAEVGVRYRGLYNLAIGYEAHGNTLPGESLSARTSGLRITTGYTLP